MAKTKNILSSETTLSGYKELFKSTIKKADGETVVAIPLEELHPPDFHPFQVNNDSSMERLMNSIQKYGIREPGLARPRPEGGYELISGNRRKLACELAGIPTLPVIIRNMDDDNAAIAMVDANLEQRDTILPSERAWAYKVKMEALNHSGKKGDKHSHEILMEQTGESKSQLFRLIRLTELVISLLDKVDTKKLAITPAAELSYLTQTEQAAVADAMDKYEIKPSLSQAQRLKKLNQAGELTVNVIDEILSENKKPDKDPLDGNEGGDSCDMSENEDIEASPSQVENRYEAGINQFRGYFPNHYSTQQMCEVITNLLTTWQSEGVPA